MNRGLAAIGLSLVVATGCATTEGFEDAVDQGPTCNEEACFLSCLSDGFPGGACRGGLCTCLSADAEVDDAGETGPDIGDDDAVETTDDAIETTDDAIETTDDAIETTDDAADDARDTTDDAADVADDAPLPVACGDGLLAGTEQCDDGNTLAGDGCSPTCRLETCGDGVVGVVLPGNDGFESGDFSRFPWVPGTTYPFTVSSVRAYEGTRSAAPGNTGFHSTTSTLSLRRVSDGRVCFWYAGESESCCDFFRFNVDGVNRLNVAGAYTAWRELCVDVTPGEHLFEWSYQKDISVNTGWDAFHIDDVRWSAGGTEQCDDGNTVAGDGCSERCTLEICGSGVLDVGEACDDGNTVGGDGCSPTCEWEFCGDGVVGDLLWEADSFETGDFSRFPWIPGATRSFAVSSTRAFSGTRSAASGNAAVTSSTSTLSLRRRTDGRVCFGYAGESESCCDHFRFNVDGINRLDVAGDYRTWRELCLDVTPGEHLFEWSYQKDGSVNTGWDAFHIDDVRWSNTMTEECDDGGTIGGDGCSAVCINEECGNGILDPGEECDDGNDVDTDACRNSCVHPVCGDGLTSRFEPLEGFESGDLTAFPWTTGTGSAAFAVSTLAGARHSGAYGTLSQNNGVHNSTSWIQTSMTTEAGRICFWYTGESESCCDRFRFLVDSVERLNAGGTVAWTEFCYDITVGAHVFRWQYSKDSSVHTGTDRFALDDIRFPFVAEECDDGNTEDGDGCSSRCRTE